MPRSSEDASRGFASAMDNLLLPIAAAFVCVVCASQAFTAVPAVRAFVDRAEGRFVAQPVQANPSIHGDVTISAAAPGASGTSSQSLAWIVCDGTTTPLVAGQPVTLTVHDGDHVLLKKNPDIPSVNITLDHNDPNLLQPASGWSTTLNGTQTETAIPTFHFAH